MYRPKKDELNEKWNIVSNEELYYLYYNLKVLIGGASPGWGWEFFSSPSCPDWHWGPPSLLPSG